MKQAVFIAFLWALLPLLPAFWAGAIAGSPYTDLYPSVWSLWAVSDWLEHSFRLSLLNHPEGQDWYPNALILGLIAKPLYLVLSPAWVYNILLLSSRWIGAIAFYMAGYSWTQNKNTSLFFMVLVACSPFIHGSSVEGIIEGTQIWPLGFWLWAMGTKRYRLGILFFCLSILSNWYFGAVSCMLCFLLGFKDRKIWLSFIGLLPAAPLIGLFLSTLSTSAKIPADIIQAMGFQWGIPDPNILSAPNPFAINTYIGWIPLLLLLTGRTRRAFWILIPFLLSLGLPELYQLPLLSSFRFPYRWHLGTMIILGWALFQHPWLQRKSFLPMLILIEYLLLSPIDIILPMSDPSYPQYLDEIDAVVLDIPGPLSRPAGTINPSRPRMKYLLYYQTKHKQPISWKVDFNGLQQMNNCFFETRILDPFANSEELKEHGNISCWKEVEWVVIHNNSSKFDQILQNLGYSKQPASTLQQIWKREK